MNYIDSKNITFEQKHIGIGIFGSLLDKMKFYHYLTPYLKLLAGGISKIVTFEQKLIRFGTFWELIG